MSKRNDEQSGDVLAFLEGLIQLNSSFSRGDQTSVLHGSVLGVGTILESETRFFVSTEDSLRYFYSLLKHKLESTKVPTPPNMVQREWLSMQTEYDRVIVGKVSGQVQARRVYLRRTVPVPSGELPSELGDSLTVITRAYPRLVRSTHQFVQLYSRMRAACKFSLKMITKITKKVIVLNLRLSLFTEKPL